MESQIIQSPRIVKISQSTLQFRQLISSLRANQHLPKVDQSHPKYSQKEGELSSESTVATPATHNLSQSWINPEQQDHTLKHRPKLSAAGRDILRHRDRQIASIFETNCIGKSKVPAEQIPISSQIPENYKEENHSLEIHKKSASTQYDLEPAPREQSFGSPRNVAKVGQIVRQGVSLLSHKQLSLNINKIRDLSQNKLLEFLSHQKKLEQKSQPSQIFGFFTDLCRACGIVVKSSSIKKYKNCVYFGYPMNRQQIYQGFLYFYDNKIYYGQFLNGVKHGRGVQIHINENVKYKGEFKEGQKSGKFYIEKPKEKYVGYVQNGVYQGQGRLTTDDWIYEGYFDKGEKNGYGQEFYSKTGVKITGYFRNGVVQKTKVSKSNPQFRSKNKLRITKDKEKLERIKIASLEKHNTRMNKIRQRNNESEYEMQFQIGEEYRERPKLNFNVSKLEMYRQAPKKLPKLCQDFQYSIDKSSRKDFQSISSNYEQIKPVKSQRSREVQIKPHRGSLFERIDTSEHEQALPTPCLTMTRFRR